MGDPANKHSNGNGNNSTEDERIIWEDGKFAIIEAGDCWDGLARSKTRDNLGDAVRATWDPGMTTMPGPQSVAAKKLVKVSLGDLLAKPQVQVNPAGVFPSPKAFKQDASTPVAPPSPFLPKPWAGKNVPEFPHSCPACGGRYYKGLDKIIHETTEHDPQLRGACPGPQAKAQKRARA